MLLQKLLLFAWLILVTAGAASAFDFAPFRARNLSPPVLVQEVAVAEPARLLPAGERRAYLDYNLASHASINDRVDEQIRLDGETTAVFAGLRWGIGERLQVGLDLPWVGHDGGSFDGFISNWHDFFGLPNGDRDELPEDDLDFSYRRNGMSRLSLDSPADGLGDIRLQLARQLKLDREGASALYVTVKMPTGDADKLTGNEGWGAAIALSGESRTFSEGRASGAVWAGIEAAWHEKGEVLSERARQGAVHAWGGAGWSPLERLAFKLQLDLRTGGYDSELAELKSPALMLNMGGTLALGERTALDIAVGEDLSVNASPDVSLHLGLSHEF